MNIRKGDQVLVNLAPFIGWTQPAEESVPCDVLAVEASRVHVRAQPPLRAVSLWVGADLVKLAPAGRRRLASAR